MLRPASHDDLDALVALCRCANDAPYDLAAVAREKCFGRGYAGETVVRVFEQAGAIRGVAVTCGRVLRILAVDREHRRRGIGSELLQDAETRAHIVFAEGGNYFTPGIDGNDEATRSFFRNRRYIEARWTWNLETAQLPDSIPEGIIRATPADQQRVLSYIEREFGPIWRFECSRAFEHDEPRMFVAQRDGELIGFAAHNINNVGLGFFGPTGVSKEARGRGHGRALLLASLADLRRMNFARVVIPWTDAIDFYRKSCGAEPTHRFVTLTRQK